MHRRADLSQPLRQAGRISAVRLDDERSRLTVAGPGGVIQPRRRASDPRGRCNRIRESRHDTDDLVPGAGFRRALRRRVRVADATTKDVAATGKPLCECLVHNDGVCAGARV